MDMVAGPHLPGLEVLQDVDLPDPGIGLLLPAVPVAVVLEEVPSQALAESFIPCLRPREFVLQFLAHGSI